MCYSEYLVIICNIWDIECKNVDNSLYGDCCVLTSMLEDLHNDKLGVFRLIYLVVNVDLSVSNVGMKLLWAHVTM